MIVLDWIHFQARHTKWTGIVNDATRTKAEKKFYLVPRVVRSRDTCLFVYSSIMFRHNDPSRLYMALWCYQLSDVNGQSMTIHCALCDNRWKFFIYFKPNKICADNINNVFSFIVDAFNFEKCTKKKKKIKLWFIRWLINVLFCCSWCDRTGSNASNKLRIQRIIQNALIIFLVNHKFRKFFN